MEYYKLLQQCLPLAVLKLFTTKTLIIVVLQIVATVPTACGIETCSDVCEDSAYLLLHVATVPTACGIETFSTEYSFTANFNSCNSAYRLRY